LTITYYKKLKNLVIEAKRLVDVTQTKKTIAIKYTKYIIIVRSLWKYICQKYKSHTRLLNATKSNSSCIE